MLKTMQKGFGMHAVLPAIAILAVLGIGGYLTKHYYEVSQQRKSFMAAKEQVNRLGAAIATETKPTKHQAVQYCDYGHAKWGPVGRTCWTEYYLQWNNVDDEKAIKVFNDSIARVKSVSARYRSINDPIISNDPTRKAESLSIINVEQSCIRELFFNDGGEYIRFKKLGLPGYPFTPQKNSAIMIISCSGDAMAEYFPVRKS